MKPTFRIEGVAQLAAQLGKVGKSLGGSGLEATFLKQANVIASDAQRRAPLLTGALKKSIIARMLDKRGNNPRAAIAAVDRKKAPHAHLVEFGTSKMAAHPYFRPAVDANLSGAAKAVETDLRKSVEGAAK